MKRVRHSLFEGPFSSHLLSDPWRISSSLSFQTHVAFGDASFTSRSIVNDSAWYYNCYMAKIDPSGEIFWEQSIGGEKDEAFNRIVPSPDNGCVVVDKTESKGSGYGDILILKIGPDGTYEF